MKWNRMIVSQFLNLTLSLFVLKDSRFCRAQSVVHYSRIFLAYIYQGFFPFSAQSAIVARRLKTSLLLHPWMSDSLPLPINFPKVSICRLSPLSFTSAKIGKEPSSEKPKASKTLKLVYILICTKCEAVAYGCLR